jgi:hypothetical protein
MGDGQRIAMMKLFKKQRPSSILGLSLEGDRLEAAVLRRSGGSVQVQQAVSAVLAVSPLGGDPELVGREIRNHLEQAGIRERRCAVCLPLSWILSMQTTLPDLPDADLASFLQIEAERGFHAGQENLFMVESRAAGAAGQKIATLMAVPRDHLATLEKALRAAQLKPLSFSTGILALNQTGRETPDGTIVLLPGAHGIGLLVFAGGGVIALRSLDAAVETEGAQRKLDADLVAREIRITLGQLPGGFADKLRTIKIFGRGDATRQFADELSRRVGGMGLKVEAVEQMPVSFSQPPPADFAVSPAVAMAADYLQGVATPEFLPPKVKPWQQLLNSKFSSKRLVWAGAGAGAVVLLVAGAFAVQQLKFHSLETEWSKLAPKYDVLTNQLTKIKTFGPWFDQSYRALAILRKLTEAFPEQGSQAYVKTIEIREQNQVSCSGIARDNAAYLAICKALSESKEITGLSTEYLRGSAPKQFALNFIWVGGKSGGN